MTLVTYLLHLSLKVLIVILNKTWCSDKLISITDTLSCSHTHNDFSKLWMFVIKSSKYTINQLDRKTLSYWYMQKDPISKYSPPHVYCTVTAWLREHFHQAWYLKVCNSHHWQKTKHFQTTAFNKTSYRKHSISKQSCFHLYTLYTHLAIPCDNS